MIQKVKRKSAKKSLPEYKLGYYLSGKHEPDVCAHFGCGKHLTLRESLFGRHCIEHNGIEKEDITKIINRMSYNNSGIIYDLGDNRFGLGIHSEQHETFTRQNKVYLHIFSDRFCTKPVQDETTGKRYATLKHMSKIKPIGFAD